MSHSSIDTSTAKHLRQFIERVERLEEEKTGIAQDIRDVMAEAKMQGFDVKVMRQVMKLRKMKNDERQEQEHLLAVYLHAIEVSTAAHEVAEAKEAA